MIIIELFAGVGGFRLGLEGFKPQKSKHYFSLLNGYRKDKNKKKIEHPEYFITGVANQFEPSTKTVQHAAEIYETQFPDGTLINKSVDEIDGRTILDSIRKNVPAERLNEELILVGGFPCQDYSVAGRLDLSKGMQGKKGILWWNIFNILLDLKKLSNPPQFILLENVDRLLKSPVNAKGKDFTTILHCLHYLGYDVEYMVINAGEYGFPQRRRRVFIMAHRANTPPKSPILKDAFSFDVKGQEEKMILFNKKCSRKDLEQSITNYNLGWDFKKSPYLNYGTITSGVLRTSNFTPLKSHNKSTLKSILHKRRDGEIPSEFFITKNELKKWEEAKGASKKERIGLNRETGRRDFIYNFSVGKMATFDELNRPIRTIITSEGGRTPSRTKHLIKVPENMSSDHQPGMRRLTPLELERANCFPDNFTEHPKVSDNRRAFIMGNALVIGIVEKIRNSIITNHVTRPKRQ